MKALLPILFLLLAALTPSGAAPVQPVPESVRRDFQLSPFYQKYVDVEGLPIVGSGRASDYALAEAEWIVRHMLPDRRDILRAIADSRIRLSVMAWNEFTTDIPEHSDLTPHAYWDRRARGLGATLERPSISCAEENLLGYPDDPYGQENILIHEFSHTIHEIGLRKVDPTFDGRLRKAYDDAMKAGLWTGTYSATNRKEYWAEGAQSWYDAASPRVTHGVNTREKLKAYDPDLAKLCEEIFGDRDWRYRKPSARVPEELSHLEGFNPALAPKFAWRKDLTDESSSKQKP